MDQIASVGIKDVGVIISPETGGQIKEALLPNPWNLSFNFILQSEPKGLAHAVWTAKEYLGQDCFLMYLGDNLIGQSIKTFCDDFHRLNSDALVLLKEVQEPRMFGVADVDRNGKIRKLIEKPKEPPSNLALVGIYLFSPLIHDMISLIKPSFRGELEITDAIQKLIEMNYVVHSHILKSWWLDTGKKDDLLEANSVVLDELTVRNIEGVLDSISKVHGRVHIERDCKVKESTIRGPVKIGQGSVIENSFVGPYTSIGNNCLLENVVIENSVVLDCSQLINIERIEDSVIGRNARVFSDSKNHKALRVLIGDDSEVSL